jgi:hypothetical protein
MDTKSWVVSQPKGAAYFHVDVASDPAPYGNLATVWSSDDAGETAYLMAAAPDLYAALKQISIMVDMEKAREVASIAIAKVEPPSPANSLP